jgi:hypothetical protein
MHNEVISLAKFLSRTYAKKEAFISALEKDEIMTNDTPRVRNVLCYFNWFLKLRQHSADYF